ncbi:MULTISPECIES: hypothetical protein [Terrabacteria group]|uniref:hypothetical protein n=1 Tax=Bacillati TaxID=1783272 RepID=UPI00193A7968|nr:MULTISPECIES: hypothetical protein [Terrabacteria group]MBW9211811.1 hypothetical protein [Trueperella sp. zg.1013]QRG87384.1 hypothetical protein JOS54_03490 [Bulleidia sp. zg-1006]
MKKSTIYSIVGIVLILFLPVILWITRYFLNLLSVIYFIDINNYVSPVILSICIVIVGILIFIKGLLIYFWEEKK